MKATLSKLKVNASFIHQAFVGEYPRLLKLCKGMAARIPQQNRLENLGTGVTDQVEMEMLAKAMVSFETSYLTQSLERMFDPVTIVFPQGGRTPPSVDEVVGICKAIETELHVASGDVRFAMLIARNVAKTIQLYGANSEQMFATGAEALEA